ncbi:MAG: radical SAM protein [Spirulina sp. SIO3F2]|nr:radical SAM protein [Spirulina sp. SIO3F2]
MPSQVDLLLINPNNRKRIYQSLASELTAIEPPIWAGLMATFMRQKGYSVQILDACADNLEPAEIAEQVAAIEPLLVAIVVYGHQPSASTQVMAGGSAVCSAVKKQIPSQKMIIVGGHVAALPERSLREEDTDFIASGEGLYTLSDLITTLKTAQPDYSQVRGLWYFEGSEVCSNAGAPLVQDLDSELPGIAWDLLPMEKYRAHNWHCFDGSSRHPYAALYTTLGCPFRCSFCCIQAPFKEGEALLGQTGNSYRYWSLDHVIQEIDILVNQYGVRNLKIADEMFVLNAKHVLGICDRIIERGYDLNIWAYARVDTVQEQMLDTLKRAGVNWLALGIEAASDRVRDNVHKEIGQTDIYKTIRKIRNAGINVIGNYIFGLPEDNFESMQATLDLALELNCEFANFYSTMAYPGSQLYNLALRKGWELPSSWAGYSQHAFESLPLRTQYLSAAQVLVFRDNAFQSYFSSPHYLKMINEKFGKGTVQHIKKMAAHKLERKISKGTHH